MVTIRIPAPSSMLIANVMAVLGLAGVVVAVGGLAGWWWALLTAGVVAVGLAAIAMTHLDEGEVAPVSGAAAARVAGPRPVAVEESRSA